MIKVPSSWAIHTSRETQSGLQFAAVWRSVVQCGAVCCSVVPCGAVIEVQPIVLLSGAMIEVQPILLGVTFSKAVYIVGYCSKLKDQSSNVSYATSQ